jgi:hypothetical protein
LKYLSSDELEGRDWDKGNGKAADYLEQFLKQYVKPYFSYRDTLSNF